MSAHESGKQPLSLNAWRTLAEHRIEAAVREGAFENLKGFGQPLPEIDASDQNWWLKQKCRDEGLQVLPPALELKRDVESELRSLQSRWKKMSQAEVSVSIKRINSMIEKRSYSIGWGPSSDVQTLDESLLLEQWRQTRH